MRREGTTFLFWVLFYPPAFRIRDEPKPCLFVFLPVLYCWLFLEINLRAFLEGLVGSVSVLGIERGKWPHGCSPAGWSPRSPPHPPRKRERLREMKHCLASFCAILGSQSGRKYGAIIGRSFQRKPRVSS